MIINAIMLGLSRKQARERFDDIIAFAELEEFIDLKLKNYSSGMHVRLAFATAIQVDADILLIDEVLAVGDAAFQQKCFDEFTRLQRGRPDDRCSSRTTWAPSSASATARCCSSAGGWSTSASPSSIARQYNQLNFHRDRRRPLADAAGRRRARPDAASPRSLNAWFESPDGEVIVTANQGEPCVIRMEVRFLADAEDPIFAITLAERAGHVVFATSTNVHEVATGPLRARDDRDRSGSASRTGSRPAATG